MPVSVVTSGGGFSGPAAVTLTGLPSGVTVSSYPDNQVFTSGPLAVTINVASNVALGNYPFTATVTGGSLSASTGGVLTVTMPDFSLSVASSPFTVAPTSQATVAVIVTPLYGLNTTVGLTASGLPAGATSFQPNNVSGPNPSTSSLTIATTNVPPGSYPFTITGTAGLLTRSTSATLVVDPTALPYPWVTQGIGTGSTGGTASNTQGVIRVSALGGALNSPADSFQLVSSRLLCICMCQASLQVRCLRRAAKYTVIQFPAGQPAGAYIIKANASTGTPPITHHGNQRRDLPHSHRQLAEFEDRSFCLRNAKL